VSGVGDGVSRERRLGDLVARARREGGFTQTELADRTGLTLWEVERLESGQADASTHLASISKATQKPESWFWRDDAPAQIEPATAHEIALDSARDSVGDTAGRNVVLAAIALLVLIRFFTEIAHVLPRAANFVDVPLLAALLVRASLVPSLRARDDVPLRSFFIPTLGFVAVCVLSALVNLSRVEPGPVLLFVYGFVAPLAFFHASYRLWPVGQAASLSRFLVGLGVVELLVVFVFSLPRFLRTGNPDDISGTFGTNAYQLVFFLIVFSTLLIGIQTFESRRAIARLGIPLVAACFLVIFLAQYRALLVTTALSAIVVGALIGAVRGRGLLVGAMSLVLLVLGLSFVAQHFPALYLKPTVEAIRQDPGAFVSSRLRIAGDVLDLYTQNPQFAVTGSGPGTYSSRAWRTFADVHSKSRSNVAGRYVAEITGGREYHTDVSDRYVLPRYRSATTILGSRAPDSPFASYTALLAEVGILGFVLLVAMYVGAVLQAGKMALTAMRWRLRDDPLPALLLATTIAFFVLLQMAALDNWLEVTRITVPAWILLAVTTKEFEARSSLGPRW
jgi:transcriptional regulator with XRE-family HTH domain